MKTYQIGTLSALILTILMGFQNCGKTGMSAASGQPSSQNSLAKEVQDLRTLLETINADDLSCNLDSDCVATPVGLRACGGPETFIVSSHVGARYQDVVTVAEVLKNKTRDMLISNNLVGTCITPMAPAVHCVSNVCQ